MSLPIGLESCPDQDPSSQIFPATGLTPVLVAQTLRILYGELSAWAEVQAQLQEFVTSVKENRARTTAFTASRSGSETATGA